MTARWCTLSGRTQASQRGAILTFAAFLVLASLFAFRQELPLQEYAATKIAALTAIRSKTAAGSAWTSITLAQMTTAASDLMATTSAMDASATTPSTTHFAAPSATRNLIHTAAAGASANQGLDQIRAAKIAAFDEYAAICAAVKDQAPDLPEWFQHHYHHLGIRRFYIVDDHSSPPLSTQYRPDEWGIPFDAITWIQLRPDDVGFQPWIYSHCQQWFGGRHRWLAYIDADEFLEVLTKPTLAEFLVDFEDQGALAVNWQIHSSGNHTVRQPAVRKAYTECIFDDEAGGGENSENNHVKSIVNTAYFDRPSTPHSFYVKGGKQTVGENHDVISPNGHHMRKPITREKIVLHHYAVKSLEEFQEKMARSNADGLPKDMSFFNRINSYPMVTCDSLSRLEP